LKQTKRNIKKAATTKQRVKQSCFAGVVVVVVVRSIDDG